MFSESRFRFMNGVGIEVVEMMAGVVICMGSEGMGVGICVEV